MTSMTTERIWKSGQRMITMFTMEQMLQSPILLVQITKRIGMLLQWLELILTKRSLTQAMCLARLLGLVVMIPTQFWLTLLIQTLGQLG